MTLKIEKYSDGDCTTIRLIGWMRAGQVERSAQGAERRRLRESSPSARIRCGAWLTESVTRRGGYMAGRNRLGGLAAKPIINHYEEDYTMSTYTAATVPTQFVEAHGIRFACRRWASEAVCSLSLTSTSPETSTTGILRFWTGLPRSVRSSSSMMQVSLVRPAKCRRPLQAWRRTRGSVHQWSRIDEEFSK